MIEELSMEQGRGSKEARKAEWCFLYIQNSMLLLYKYMIPPLANSQDKRLYVQKRVKRLLLAVQILLLAQMQLQIQ
jgi:hypothetical protein